MRFPKLSELDKDQAAIYQGGPSDGTMLIVGPPGTGKSVIAFHRAHMLSKLDRNPRVLMFNKVLARYASSRGGVAPDVTVATLHSWTFGWWRTFAGWKSRPPTVNGERYDHDWGAIRDKAIQVAVEGAHEKVSWGHLVIDEGQDFPPTMYGALKVVMDVANASGAKPRLAMTVLADENQRLTANRNSTVEEIKVNLGLVVDDRNVFLLQKNYRNTREIAAFAGAFYVGLASGCPALPKRSGDDPTVSVLAADTHDKFLTACAEKIARYAKVRRTEEVGVIVMGNKERIKVVNRLKGRLDGSGVMLQTYASGDETCPAEALEFDTPGHVTVINYNSAKGLEFDAVFVVDPGRLMTGGSSDLHTRMAMYVMCSRARSTLHVLLLDDEGAKSVLSWPDAKTYVLESA